MLVNVNGVVDGFLPAVFADVLGETGGDRVEITLGGKPMVSATVSELREAYESALERALRTEGAPIAAN